ncbi:MAG: type II toxin-antitoxin system Phd/YefM family antitoxin [Brevundimonas sp.]|uniref:type II toxin-antitoxin system Phd/YefM family antitoxin n=1 Tax=Brevundimonas sp. TaxID=1871086 RepID=UPI00273634AC|nr:type II toxin-antitoxin system Phd/YefM family antitoxin [Brevundimonas sp.]MDP3377615.1 type II toxin-antitoxin system Phd/YefM family antitoxin [Brevundimonas sp.]
MTEVAATEFARNFGRYREEVQREPIAVKVHDRVTGYFVSARDYDEYQRLKGMMATALASEQLDADTVRALSEARMDPRHADLDALMD